MPTPSPKRGWASLQGRVLIDVKHFCLGSLRHVKEVSVTDLTGRTIRELRPEPLAFHMAEEVSSPSVSKVDAAAEEEQARLMVMRKAMAKVHLRTALDNELQKVDEGLFISGAGGAKNWEALEGAGITHVINASPAIPCFFKGKSSIEYLMVDVYDTAEADIAQHFEAASEFISSALSEGGSVLVHCYAGQSRSTTLLAAHLMLTRGLGLGEALAMLQAARPSVCPNLGFIRQLKLLEKDLCSTQKGAVPPKQRTEACKTPRQNHQQQEQQQQREHHQAPEAPEQLTARGE